MADLELKYAHLARHEISLGFEDCRRELPSSIAAEWPLESATIRAGRDHLIEGRRRPWRKSRDAGLSELNQGAGDGERESI